MVYLNLLLSSSNWADFHLADAAFIVPHREIPQNRFTQVTYSSLNRYSIPLFRWIGSCGQRIVRILSMQTSFLTESPLDYTISRAISLHLLLSFSVCKLQYPRSIINRQFRNLHSRCCNSKLLWIIDKATLRLCIQKALILSSFITPLSALSLNVRVYWYDLTISTHFSIVTGWRNIFPIDKSFINQLVKENKITTWHLWRLKSIKCKGKEDTR